MLSSDTKKLKRYTKLESLTFNFVEEIENLLVYANNIPKPLGKSGYAKYQVCGIDRDENKVL